MGWFLIIPPKRHPRVFLYCSGDFLLLCSEGNARGGNPASAPNNQRLLTGSPLQTQEIRPGKKSFEAFGNERGPIADVLHALYDVIFKYCVFFFVFSALVIPQNKLKKSIQMLHAVGVVIARVLIITIYRPACSDRGCSS